MACWRGLTKADMRVSVDRRRVSVQAQVQVQAKRDKRDKQDKQDKRAKGIL